MASRDTALAMTPWPAGCPGRPSLRTTNTSSGVSSTRATSCATGTPLGEASYHVVSVGELLQLACERHARMLPVGEPAAARPPLIRHESQQCNRSTGPKISRR